MVYRLIRVCIWKSCWVRSSYPYFWSRNIKDFYIPLFPILGFLSTSLHVWSFTKLICKIRKDFSDRLYIDSGWRRVKILLNGTNSLSHISSVKPFSEVVMKTFWINYQNNNAIGRNVLKKNVRRRVWTIFAHQLLWENSFFPNIVDWTQQR